MIEHLSKTDLNRYSKRMLSPAELLVVTDHLAVCEECYQHFNAEELLAPTAAFVKSALKPAEDEDLDHLTYDQITAFVSNELNEFERDCAQVHLAICSQCEVIRQEILRYSRDVNFDKVYGPVVKPTYRERLQELWKIPIDRIPLIATGLLIVLVIIAWTATFPLRQRLTNLQAQIDQLRQENASFRNSNSNLTKLEGEIERLSSENLRLQRLFLLSQDDRANGRNSAAKEFAARPPRILFSLNDGDGKVVLDDQGGLTGLNFIAPKYQNAVKIALKLQRAESPASLKNLTEKRKNLLGVNSNPSSFTLLDPVGTVVLTTEPTLRWTSLDGAAGYNVTIYSGNMKKTVSSEVLTVTEWKPPSLARGRIYSWQVRAVKDGKEIVSPAPDAPEAQFKILEKSLAEELERAKGLYAKSHLTLGVLYARFGLLENAAAEFRALLNANPNSPIVEKLIRSVTSKQRQPNLR